MNKKLLTLILTLFITSTLLAQVTSGQIDDFEDGTKQGWGIGATATNQPTNEVTDGPAGVNDNFFKYTTNGNPNGAGSKLVIFNKNSNWIGDYTSASVFGIKFDVRVTGSDLNLRVAFQNSLTGDQICTTNSVVVTAGSGWTSVVIPITASDMQVVGIGTETVANLLSGGNIDQIRILSNVVPSWFGQAFSGVPTTLDIDNIETSSLLSVNGKDLLNSFSISPNPGIDRLNIKVEKLQNNTNLEVFDVLGKRIFTNKVSNVSSPIDVSQWNSGVYLVRITTDTGTQTKRFVKQ
jgi:Secretion system C-terminal sorting domain